MKISIIFGALLAVITLSAPALRADDATTATEVSSTETKYLKDFVDALENKNTEAARELMKAPNFSPMLVGYRRYTLFQEALENDNAEIARLMVQSPVWKKATWDSEDSRRALKTAASSEKLFPILQALAGQPSFDVNALDDVREDTLLFVAARDDNMLAVKWLVKLPKFAVTQADKDGENALFHADVNALKYLVSLHKFDVNHRAKDGKTALHIAARDMSGGRVRALLADPKINPNLKDKSGKTALDYAMVRDYNWKPNPGIALMSNRKVKPTAKQQKEWKRIRNLPAPPWKSPPDLLPFPGTMTGSND